MSSSSLSSPGKFLSSSSVSSRRAIWGGGVGGGCWEGVFLGLSEILRVVGGGELVLAENRGGVVMVLVVI